MGMVLKGWVGVWVKEFWVWRGRGIASIQYDV